MNEAWDELQPLYEVNGKCIVERGADLQRVSSSPLSALFYFVDMGFYPPPELLFALHDCWETYESAGGRTSLEQAFLGKTVQKSGNYAKRQNAKFQRMVMRWNFEKYIQDGLTRTQAAEIISEVWGGKPEPESILRMFRTKGTRERAKREK
ncbi:MAG: hypothetical protein OJF55_002853 [Rhodanobacteraceae bacterium]|nr:MAG: hypothetical protein OJF55_002853 [Rhodanobacteraceae bacterium]